VALVQQARLGFLGNANQITGMLVPRTDKLLTRDCRKGGRRLSSRWCLNHLKMSRIRMIELYGACHVGIMFLSVAKELSFIICDINGGWTTLRQ